MYEQANTELRRRISIQQQENATITKRDAEWQQAVELFVAATKREACYFPQPGDVQPELLIDAHHLTTAILAEAKQREADGEFERAADLYFALLRLSGHLRSQASWVYEFYANGLEQETFAALPHWAAHEGVTAERVREFLDEFLKWSRNNSPNWKRHIRFSYLLTQRLLDGDPSVLERDVNMDDTQQSALRVLSFLMPWEKRRSMRMLRVYSETELQRLAKIDELSARGFSAEKTYNNQPTQIRLANGDVRSVDAAVLNHWMATTPWLRMTLKNFRFADLFARFRLEREAIATQLALIAWQKQHGELPQTLDALIGHGLDEMPIDPYTGLPFVYVREGLEHEAGDGTMHIKRTSPLIWSPTGQEFYYVAPDGSGAKKIDLAPTWEDFRDRRQNRLTEEDVLNRGTSFFIPN